MTVLLIATASSDFVDRMRRLHCHGNKFLISPRDNYEGEIVSHAIFEALQSHRIFKKNQDFQQRNLILSKTSVWISSCKDAKSDTTIMQKIVTEKLDLYCLIDRTKSWSVVGRGAGCHMPCA